MKGPHLTGFTREMGNPQRLMLAVPGAHLEAERFSNPSGKPEDLSSNAVHAVLWASPLPC